MMNVRTSPIQAYDFLFQDGVDHLGWSRNDYLQATDVEWEKNHDMIQWLFPTWEPSRFNPYAPVVPYAMLNEWGQQPQLKQIVLENVQRFLAFLGFDYDIELCQITSSTGNEWNIENWLPYPTHNDLRITRVLEHMYAMKLKEEAKYVYSILFQQVSDRRIQINETTMMYWKHAAFGLQKPETALGWNTTFLIDDLENLS